MSNVISLLGAANDEPVPPKDPVEPIAVLHCLYSLFASRAIGQEAFFLGAHVVQRMVKANSRQTILPGLDAQTSLVKVANSVYAGPITRVGLEYISALQDLHFRAGIWNSLSEAGLGDISRATKHFTLSPGLTFGVHYSFDTPIYYRVMPTTRHEYLRMANKLVASSLEQCEQLHLD